VKTWLAGAVRHSASTILLEYSHGRDSGVSAPRGAIDIPYQYNTISTIVRPTSATRTSSEQPAGGKELEFGNSGDSSIIYLSYSIVYPSLRDR
jgi:hypothetical protein